LIDASFADRFEAGRELATRLTKYRGQKDTVVLALPRGGVPVAYEVATRLRLPLDVFIVRKLGVPGYEELAMGALASGGVCVLNEDLLAQLPDAKQLVEKVAAMEREEIERREREYRDGRPPRVLDGCTVLLVDDGVATGATMRAAVEALRRQNVAKIVAAIPVGAPQTCAELKEEADEAVCILEPESFYAVGQYYRDFSQITDDEARAFLAAAARGASS
jgi:putative phosphoribosyl transferase